MEKPVDQQVDRLHELFEEGMVQSFEWKTRSKKSSEPCWMTDTIREIIEDRRKMFKTDGFRATRWKILKRKTSTIIKARIANYNEHILSKFKGGADPKNFFRNVNCLLGVNTKPRWTPHDMYPSL